MSELGNYARFRVPQEMARRVLSLHGAIKICFRWKAILHHLLEIHGGGDLVEQSPVSLRGAQDARKHGSKEKGNWLFFENVFFPALFSRFFSSFLVGRGLLLFCWSMQKDICKADCD